MTDKPPIYVTRPYLPPFEEYCAQLQSVWETRWLTNGGALHQRLEAALKNHLGVAEISLFNNATSGLISALAVLNLSGEVITTPYSFIATAHAILWNNLMPVFVDIEPETLNIDPAKIEAAITEHTSAIMAVHCYGNPCDVQAIEAIAKKHNLKVIYDAAHAFGVEVGGRSILNYGDLSVLSFHATKVFNTFEGGAIVCKDAGMKKHIDAFKNFGIGDDAQYEQIGLNGKMNEAQAAFGLAQLPYISTNTAGRGRVDRLYRQALQAVNSISPLPAAQNFGYFPVLVGDDYALSRDGLFAALKLENIIARKYFYPLISDVPLYKIFPSATPTNLPVAAQAAQKILCLPIYPDLSEQEQGRVLDVIREYV